MQFFTETPGKFLFLRLEPGELLLEGILEGCAKAGVTYGSIISCIGSLKHTEYTYPMVYNESSAGIKYRETIKSDESNELISGQGTIGVSDGKADIHVHALMVDVNGKLFSGHMMPKCEVLVTMEIAIAVAETSGTMLRAIDPAMKLPVFQFFPAA